MDERGTYGDRLGRIFGLKNVPTFTTRTFGMAQLAVTEIRCDSPGHGMTAPIPLQDAYIVALQVRQCPDHKLWLEGRQTDSRPFSGGVTSIYDLRRNPIAYIGSPFHSLHFYLPLRALDEVADEIGARRIGDLHYTPGVGDDDPIMRSLMASLYPSLQRPEEANRLFVDHVVLALRLHVADVYGRMHAHQRPSQGGLAPWQERRAKDLMRDDIDGGLTLSRLAGECGLSVSHFARAFRQSTGTSPHRWLLGLRLEKAKAMLLESSLPLTEVALACGFASQSHLTRVFARRVGASPGTWRRMKRS